LNNQKFNLLDLYKLQLLDNKISFLEKEMEKLKSDEELKTLKEDLNDSILKLKDLNDNLNGLEKEKRKLEDDLSIKNEKIKKNEQKLSSGTLTSTKEIISYQEEIVSIKKLNEEIENKIIEILIKIDDLNELIKLENDKKDKINAHVNKLEDEINDKLSIIDQKLKNYNDKRENIVVNIPQDLIVQYNDLKQKKGGLAIGILKDRLCTACNMEMSAGEANKMDDFNQIYKCPTCRRMIIKYREEIDIINEEFSE
jgi:predicted  nucleic acid-binding Zn-ribbon protein